MCDLDISREKMVELFANSGDPDQMPHSTASDMGLHYLPFTLLEISSLQWVHLFHSLSNLADNKISNIFLIFPQEQDLTFHADCLQLRQFAQNVTSCFLGKILQI